MVPTIAGFCETILGRLPAREILAFLRYAKSFFENGCDSGPSFELAVEHIMIKNLAPAAGFRETTVLGASSRKKGEK